MTLNEIRLASGVSMGQLLYLAPSFSVNIPLTPEELKVVSEMMMLHGSTPARASSLISRLQRMNKLQSSI